MRTAAAIGVPERIATDEVQRAFVEHTLQIAIQAAIDIAAWILGEGQARRTGLDAFDGPTARAGMVR